MPYPQGRRVTHIHRRIIQQIDGLEGKAHHEQQTTNGEKLGAAAIAAQQEIASYDIYEGASGYASLFVKCL